MEIYPGALMNQNIVKQSKHVLHTRALVINDRICRALLLKKKNQQKQKNNKKGSIIEKIRAWRS